MTDWWSKKWHEKPHFVPTPGGQPAESLEEWKARFNAEPHVVPEPDEKPKVKKTAGVFWISCGRCDACMRFYQELCEENVWFG